MELNLELNHTYLLKFYSGDILQSGTILTITNKAYQIHWNLGNNSYDAWIEKKEFNRKYILIEDITDFIVIKESIKIQEKTVWTSCDICNGYGNVPDTSLTAGNKLCLKCKGYGLVPNYKEILT